MATVADAQVSLIQDKADRSSSPLVETAALRGFCVQVRSDTCVWPELHRVCHFHVAHPCPTVYWTICSRSESISRKALREFSDAHKDAETPLDDWYRIGRRSRWISIVDVRKTYPHADAVGKFTVFNVGGNKYRLVVTVNYRSGRIYIREVMTHAEYSREEWKKR